MSSPDKRIAIIADSDSLYWAIKRLATKRGAAAFVFFFFLMTPFWKEKVCGSCGCSVCNGNFLDIIHLSSHVMPGMPGDFVSWHARLCRFAKQRVPLLPLLFHLFDKQIQIEYTKADVYSTK